jgi:hypothetical protein
MILSRAQLEEIAMAMTYDFNHFFFGISPEEEREDPMPTPIDQLAKDKSFNILIYYRLSSFRNRTV